MSNEKHIVCKGATVYCDKSMACNSPATAIPLTITSQTLVVANGNKIVATNKDNTVANMNFGICNDPKYTFPSPKPPCMANVIWQKVFEGGEITKAGLKFLTEESEAICNTCSVPGKVKIAFHGQSVSISSREAKQASAAVLAALNPWGMQREEKFGFYEMGNSNQWDIEVEEMKMLSPLDKDNTTLEGVMIGNEYEIGVTRFNNGGMPQDLSSIKWKCRYTNTSNKTVEIINLRTNGIRLSIKIPKDAQTGTKISFSSYIKNEQKGGKLNAFIINRIYYIRLERKWEYTKGPHASQATISTFTIDDSSISGFILEPIGESTTQSGLDMRIPVGIYSLQWHVSTKFPKNKYKDRSLDNGFPKLSNNLVPAARSILIHRGNVGNHSEGCLLPGSGKKADNSGISGSSTTFNSIIDFIEEKGIDNVKVLITENITL